MKEEIIKILIDNWFKLSEDKSYIQFDNLVYEREIDGIQWQMFVKDDYITYRTHNKDNELDYCIFSFAFIEANKDLVFNYILCNT